MFQNLDKDKDYFERIKTKDCSFSKYHTMSDLESLLESKFRLFLEVGISIKQRCYLNTIENNK